MQQSLTTTIRRSIYQFLAAVNSFAGSNLPAVTILCYHGIDSSGWYHSVSLQEFEKQIAALSKRYTFISLSEVAAFLAGKKNFNKPSMCITFDDGYQSILSTQKILKKYRVKPTVFVLADPQRADRTELENSLPFLSVKEVVELQKSGWEVGCHTATHPNLKTCTTAQLKQEIETAKKKIEALTGVECRYIAYPKGKYSSDVLQSTEKAGYELGLSMDDGIITTDTSRFILPRIGINGSHSVSELMAAVSPASTAFRKTVKRILAS